ncbi:uncharacterized protein JN550_005321 [Neoarthrinium moseri]|uniref:uncharacterized protein n=1 Tax=Neoarthrinium moseri TaxID=1658444 RepID=UPI001FDE1888|nr:uncharacterized protein JN550_005321 [Neoarthrinium moseri]KAI1870393.1 hypothetical protein JN550_005321 [Neoarthrinium moseri]
MAAPRDDPTAILDPNDYAVVWIAPLEIEAQAALYMLDEQHQGRFAVDRGDEYVFHAGSMCGHNIVIATFPAGQEYGTGSAAALASQIIKCFPHYWIGLLVGVAAGLPKLSGDTPRDIRLGDVLVSLPDGERAGIIAYDLGKETDDGFQLLRRGHALTATKPIVRSAIGKIKAKAPGDAQMLLPHYEAIRDRKHATGTFADPGQDCDRLYSTIDGGEDVIIKRAHRPDNDRTRVWYGPIGSGDKLLKNALKRDELRDNYEIIGLEMEAAGTMNRIPVGVIRGVCDYGDQRKNKEWQPYAAAMAAAYAKAVLREIPPAQDPTRADGVGRNIGPKKPSIPCYHIQLPRNARFTRRGTILDQLEEKLLVRKESRRMAVVGLGGIGKTQIALHFAYNVKEKWPDYSIFWVPVLSHSSVEQAYVEIAKKLGVQKKSDDEDIKELVRQYLSSDEAGKWLLVVDNADDQELVFGSDDKSGIEEHLPDSENGLILLTTRSRHVAGEFAQSDIIHVKQMGLEEAEELLKKTLTQEQTMQDKASVTELLAHLTYLPLAITQAVAYLNQTRTPVRTYLGMLRGAEKDAARVLGREFRDNTRYRGSRNAIATTWIVSFDQIQKSNPLAVNLLSFMSCIEPKAIPKSILPGLESEGFEWAIGTLCGYSFLVQREDSDTFDMHSLVHMATCGWIEKQNREGQVMSEAIHHLEDIYPSNEGGNRDLWRGYLPHALRALERSNKYESEERAEFCMSVGLSLFADRRFKEAIRCFEQAFGWRKDHCTEDDRYRLASEQALACAYLEDRRIKEAIEMLEHIVKVERDTLDEKDPNRLASEHALACAYLEDRRIKEAIEMLEHIVEVERDALDEKDPNRLASEQALACAYLEDRRIKEAIEMLEHIVKVERDTLDEKDPNRLASEHALACAYLEDRRIKEAIEMLEHIVEVERDALDEKDPNRLASEHELARAYLEDRRIKEAIEMLEHIVEVERDALDEKDPNRLASEHELARAYLSDRRVKKAIEILEYVVKLQKETLHEKDPDRLTSEHELARAYLSDQRVNKAIEILEYVVKLQKETLHEKDHSRLLSEHELARAYLSNQRVNKAIEILEYVVKLQKETLHEKDHSRLVSEYELARAYLSDRRISEAIDLLKHVVAVKAQLYVEDDPQREVSMDLLAYAYRQLEIFSENTDSSSEFSNDNDQGHNGDSMMDRRASLEGLA